MGNFSEKVKAAYQNQWHEHPQGGVPRLQGEIREDEMHRDQKRYTEASLNWWELPERFAAFQRRINLDSHLFVRLQKGKRFCSLFAQEKRIFMTFPINWCVGRFWFFFLVKG